MIALLRANVKEAAGSLYTARQRSLLALIGIAVGRRLRDRHDLRWA